MIGLLHWAQHKMKDSLYQQGFPFSEILFGEPYLQPEECWVVFVGPTSSTSSFLIRTCPASTWDSWNASPCKWGIHSTLNSSQWFTFTMKTPSHSPRLSIPNKVYAHKLFHWKSSKRAVSLNIIWKSSVNIELLREGLPWDPAEPTHSRLWLTLWVPVVSKPGDWIYF